MMKKFPFTRKNPYAYVVMLVIAGLVFGYLMFDLAQLQKVFKVEELGVKAGINIQKSIMFLEEVRGLEKIIIDEPGNSSYKEIVIGTIGELKLLVLDSLHSAGRYYKTQPDQNRKQDFNELSRQISGLLNEPVTVSNFGTRYLVYENFIKKLQQFDTYKDKFRSRPHNKTAKVEYLLTANAQLITELIVDVSRVRDILTGARDVIRHENKVQGLELSGLLNTIKAAHRQLRHQMTSLKDRLSSPGLQWEDALLLDSELNVLEKIPDTATPKPREQQQKTAYVDIATKANASAMHLYKQIIDRHMALDRQRLAEITGSKQLVGLTGVLGIILVLGLSGIFYIRDSVTMNKLKSLNNALARSENNIRNIIEILPDIVVLQDMNGHVIMANKAFRDFYKRLAKERRTDAPDLKDPDSLFHKLLYSDAEKIASGGLLNSRIENFVWDDGENKVVQITSVPYPLDESSNAILTVIIDMTEVYKVRELQKVSGVGYWDWDLDKNKFNFSDKFYETTGIPPLSDLDNFQLYLAHTAADDRERVRAAFSRAHATSEPIDIEHRIFKNDGSEAFVRIRGNIYQRNLDDSLHMVGSVQDITVQKHAEVALKKSEMKYRKLVENLSEEYFFYSYEMDREFSYVSPSAATMFGYPQDEIYAAELLGRIIETGPLQDSKVNSAVPYNEQLVRRDIAVKNCDGSLRYLELSEVPVYSVTGEVTGFDGIAHDVTSNKRRETHIRESENRLRQLAAHLQDVRENERAGIARDIHDEIGGYLMALKMDISLLDKKLDKSDQIIHSRFQSMKQLLDIAIESTRRMITNLRPSILDELGLLDTLEWQLNVFSKRHGAKILFRHDDEVAQIEFANREYVVHIFRIFQEILNNIAKHSEAETVSVFAAVDDDWFVLSVNDDGKGAPPQAMKKQGSYGILGMQERIHKMGGTLELVSEEGVGTMVVLQIPLLLDAVSEPAADNYLEPVIGDVI